MKSVKYLVLFVIALCIEMPNPLSGQEIKKDTVKVYKDGIYSGQSRSLYTEEPYWGKIQFRVEKGLFTNIRFMIRDSALHETFNDSYAKHFEGNALYIQQTKNDWNGVKKYPEKLMAKQDIMKIDVISGATWSYNIFKASLEDALKKAR
jgi:major membrane immunogen (membrane-anchored lipoprotein)